MSDNAFDIDDILNEISKRREMRGERFAIGKILGRKSNFPLYIVEKFNRKCYNVP